MYETARVFPSGENKAKESDGESSLDNRTLSVSRLRSDMLGDKSNTENLPFSAITRFLESGEKETDGATK